MNKKRFLRVASAVLCFVLAAVVLGSCVEKPEELLESDWNGKEAFVPSSGILKNTEELAERYAEYKKELPHKQGDIELLTKLAHIALILEKKEEAKAYYGRILEIDPPNILAHEQLIDLYVNEDKFKYFNPDNQPYNVELYN